MNIRKIIAAFCRGVADALDPAIGQRDHKPLTSKQQVHVVLYGEPRSPGEAQPNHSPAPPPGPGPQLLLAHQALAAHHLGRALRRFAPEQPTVLN